MQAKKHGSVFTSKNILNVVYIGVILLLLFNPWAKATLIRVLMTVGFFQPNVSMVQKASFDTSLPDVTFLYETGKALKLSDLRGKVVFINFWATWCPPCLAEMPSINQLYEQFKNDTTIVFITVDVDGRLAKSSSFLRQHEWHLPLYQDTGNLPPVLSGNAIPLTVIFNRKGRLVYRHEGVANYSSNKMLEFIRALRR